MTNTWIDLGPVSDFPAGTQKCVWAGEREIVLFHFDDQFYAIANVCPHAGLPIGEGEQRGGVIICPYHGYAYNVKNGRNIDWPHDETPVKTYAVRVEDGRVQVQLPGEPRQPDEPDEVEDEPPRGPAPVETPEDEPVPCEPGENPDETQGEPDCPEGYPKRER